MLVFSFLGGIEKMYEVGRRGTKTKKYLEGLTKSFSVCRSLK